MDRRLAGLRARRDALANYKRGVMQRLFARDIRFTRDDGTPFPDWQQKRLGEIGQTYNGLTGKSADDFGEGKPFVTYLQVFTRSALDLTQCGNVKVLPRERQNRLQFGDIVFTTSSETPHEVGVASVLLDHPDDLYLNSFCFGFRPNSLEDLLPDFAQFLFRSPQFREKMLPLAQGSTRFNISKSSFLIQRVEIPHPEEQRKIAAFLGALDRRIDATTRQITTTEAFKRGLLQQMFV